MTYFVRPLSAKIKVFEGNARKVSGEANQKYDFIRLTRVPDFEVTFAIRD